LFGEKIGFMWLYVLSLMWQVRAKVLKKLCGIKEALELYLEDEDVEKPSKAEAPIVTIVKVDVSGSTRSLKAQSN
jgi:hypothetical protein